jgi:hypothetical protein
VDINGAKELKQRLGTNGEVEPQPACLDVDLSEDAPPVYRWLGVSRSRLECPPEEFDEPAARSTSLFSRLGLGSASRHRR